MTAMTTPVTLYPVARAQEIAAEMTAADGEGWIYRAKVNPGSKYAAVVVIDEDGFEIGEL